VLLGDAHVERPGRVLLGQLGDAGRVGHRGGDAHDVGPFVGEGHKFIGEDGGPLQRRRGGGLAGGRIERGRTVQSVRLVVHGRLVAIPLLGHRVHDDRAAIPLGPMQRALQRHHVVSVHWADVLDAQILEERLRRDRVLDPLLDGVQRLVEGAADERGAGERVLDQVQEFLVPGVQSQRGQVIGEPADGRGVRAAVVVHDDDQRVVGRRDVVERLPAHAAGERAVADHGHHMPALATQRERLRHPVRVRQRGRGVAVLDDVVLALGLVRVAGQAAPLAEQVEAALTTGHKLVYVRLMSGIK
jgi:hypothetical protein